MERLKGSMRTAVIGAGASGLSLALLLDGEVVVYEALGQAAGHCGATVRDGWTFDHGPHIMFSRNTEVLDFMVRSLQGNVHRSRRNNRVCIDGTFVKYPIENDLASLPDELRNQCLLDFLFNEHQAMAEKPRNLHEWFLGVFGAGLTDLYFKPYNEKVWNVPLADLSMSWSERIPQPPAEDVVKGALGISTEGYVHQLYFHYPRVGGYQAIPEAWANMLPAGTLRLNTPVTRLIPGENGVDLVTPTGVEHFDRVVCTAPMPAFLSMMDEVPERIQSAVDSLQLNPIVAVTLGFKGVDNNQFTAVYFPEPEYLVNRVSSPCVFSPQNGPDGCFSIQAEITAAPGDPVINRKDDDLAEHVLKGLVRHGLVREDTEVVFSDVQRFDPAYVVYTVGYERQVEMVTSWAESQGIRLHGRFGAFDYLNVDGCVIRSLELATSLNGRKTSLDEVQIDGDTTDV
jgi:protoporphyrinogen oxidase